MTSKSQQESYEKGQRDGSRGDYDPPNGGFIDTILNRPTRDCDNDVREKAYEDGHKNGSNNQKK